MDARDVDWRQLPYLRSPCVRVPAGVRNRIELRISCLGNRVRLQGDLLPVHPGREPGVHGGLRPGLQEERGGCWSDIPSVLEDDHGGLFTDMDLSMLSDLELFDSNR